MHTIVDFFDDLSSNKNALRLGDATVVFAVIAVDKDREFGLLL